MAHWAKLVAPYAESVARHVARLAKSGFGIAAPIGPKPSIDRARVKVRVRPIAAPIGQRPLRSVPIATAANACRSCGAKLTIRKRLFCDQCLPDRRGEAAAATPKLQCRGAGQNRCHARSRPRSHYDARSPAPPCRFRFAAAQSRRRRGAMTARSMAWISGATFCRSCKACRCA